MQAPREVSLACCGDALRDFEMIVISFCKYVNEFSYFNANYFKSYVIFSNNRVISSIRGRDLVGVKVK